MRQVYAVRDVKANSFAFPHFDVSHGQAIRAFGDMVRNPKTPFNSHPEDYSLYNIGSWDEIQGTLVSLKIPVLLSSAIEHAGSPMPQRNGSNGIEEILHADKS